VAYDHLAVDAADNAAENNVAENAEDRQP